MTMPGDAAEQQGSPLTPNAASLPETPESLVFGALRDGLAAIPATESDGEPDASDEGGDEQSQQQQTQPGDAVTQPASDADGVTGEPPAKPKRTAAEWAQILAREGKQRLAEISPPEREAVLLEYAEIRAREASAQTQADISEQLRQRDATSQWIAQVDANFADDPDGKLAWLESDDPRVETYRLGKRWLAQLQTQPQEQQVAGFAALNQRARREYSRLEKFPVLQSELDARRTQNRYPATEGGVAQLQTDVDELLGRAATDGGNGTSGAPDNGTRPARRSVARPLVTSAGNTGAVRQPSNAPRNVSEMTDPTELVAEGIRAGFRELRKA